MKAANIVKPEKVAAFRELTGPRLLPTRCRLSRRGRALVARDHIQARQGDSFRK